MKKLQYTFIAAAIVASTAMAAPVAQQVIRITNNNGSNSPVVMTVQGKSYTIKHNAKNYFINSNSKQFTVEYPQDHNTYNCVLKNGADWVSYNGHVTIEFEHQTNTAIDSGVLQTNVITGAQTPVACT
jgi:hypothetical protein